MNFCCDFLFVVLVYTLLVNEVVFEEEKNNFYSWFSFFDTFVGEKKLWSRFLEKWSYIISCLCFLFLFQYLFHCGLERKDKPRPNKASWCLLWQKFHAQFEHIQYSWTRKVYFRNASSHSAARFRWPGWRELRTIFFHGRLSVYHLVSSQSNENFSSSNYGGNTKRGRAKMCDRIEIFATYIILWATQFSLLSFKRFKETRLVLPETVGVSRTIPSRTTWKW